MTAPPDASLWLDNAIRLAIFAVLVWNAKTTQRLAEELRGMRAHLFGETGDNGMNSDLRRLRGDVAHIAEDQHHLRADFAVLRSDVNHMREAGR